MNRFQSFLFSSLCIRLLCAMAPTWAGLACSAGEENPADEVSELARPIELTDAQIEAIEQLESIGYLGGGESSMGRKMVGVLKYDPEAVRAGLNLFASGHAPVAILMDMEGRELHQWETTFMEVFPDAPPPTPEELEENSRHQSLRRILPFPDGDLLAIFENEGMFRIDWDSNILWRKKIACHHDLKVMPDGRIYTLVGKGDLVPRIHETEPVKLDSVVVLDPNGNELERFPIYEAYENSPFADQLVSRTPAGDIMHTNSLQVFDGALAHLSPIYADGNILISIREMSAVGILDPREGRMVWSARGSWKHQHEASLLESGKVLFFDNLGGPSEQQLSRILEIDPMSGEMQVFYGEGEGEGFGCGYLGTVARLDNGNTMVTHSLGGLVFELDPERRIVWEFQTPYHWGKYGEKIAVVFDLIRLPGDYFEDGLLDS